MKRFIALSLAIIILSTGGIIVDHNVKQFDGKEEPLSGYISNVGMSAVKSNGAVLNDNTANIGDVNFDNKINSSDALLVLKYATGTVSFNYMQVENADVNFDGKVNSSDALEILKFSTGLISGFSKPNTTKPTQTTTRKTTTTTTKNNSGVTTNDAAELVDFLATGEWLKYINWYIDEEGNITTDGDKGVLGFGYSTSEKCFYATGNAWQRNFGYSDLYDKTSQMAPICYDTSKIFFIYQGKEWMIQLWKGQYGLVLLGTEVGVYNRPQGSSSSTYFECADDSEMLPISLTVYQDNKALFARKKKLSWWMTGFVPGQMGEGAAVSSEFTKHLSVTTSIDFKDEAMRKAFVIGLKKCNFIYNNVDRTKRTIGFVEGSGTEPGTYSVNGNTVTLSWQ